MYHKNFGYNWNVTVNYKSIYDSKLFDNFEECLEHFKTNREFFQLKTIKATYNTQQIIDVRDKQYSTFHVLDYIKTQALTSSFDWEIY